MNVYIVWLNEDWENLDLYHMKNNALENNKYLLEEEKESFCWRKFLLPSFFYFYFLRKRGELMLANFGLKIRPFWDSDHENWYSYFCRKWKAFCESSLHQITYNVSTKKAIYGQKKKAPATRCQIFPDRPSFKNWKTFTLKKIRFREELR